MKLSSLLLSSALLFAVPAAAQTIEVGELGEAREFSAGLIDVTSGGLDRDAWQGTSAVLAAHLIDALPASFDHPVAHELARAALLSGGVPPEGSDAEKAAYSGARTDYLLMSGQADVLAALSKRDLDLARDRVVRTDLALASGDIKSACETSDAVQDGRAEPYWAKLRAFCHVRRDEVPAAELTTELLQSSGHEDPAYYAYMKALTKRGKAGDVQPTTALHRAMKQTLTPARPSLATTKDPFAKPAQRLEGALSALRSLSTEDMVPIMTDLATDKQSASYGFDDARDDMSPLGTARLYVLSVSSRDAMALGEFLRRMDKSGNFADAAAHFTQILQTTDPRDAARGGLDVVTRAAVLRDDLGMLQGLFSALEGGTDDAARVALISDALGGGFRLRPVGEDIEDRLIAGGEASGRAVRDTLIALALGAQISDRALIKLETAKLATPRVSVGRLIALDVAAKEGARAETALRAAAILGEGPLDAKTLGEVIAALQKVGLDRFARSAAAYDFADRL